jgi:hypothetical protein
MVQGPSWSWSYGSWIYNHLCNQFLSPLMLWVRILIGARCTICQWLVAGRCFSPGTPVFSTNKTDRHNITEILLKVALNTINKTKPNSANLVLFFLEDTCRQVNYCNSLPVKSPRWKLNRQEIRKDQWLYWR